MRPSVPYALFALAVALLLAGVGFSYWAGCTGDLKTLSLGDPIGAMRLQAIAAVAALASLVASMSAASTMHSVQAGTRVMLGVAAVLVTAVFWFTAGWEAEVQGVKQCFATP